MAFGLVLIFIILLVDIMVYRNLFSPIVMFNALFMLMIFLALQGKYGISIFDDRAIFLIEFGVIFFDAGVIFVRLILRRVTEKRDTPTQLIFRWKYIWLLVSIVTLSNFITFFYSMKFLISGGNYLQLRNALFGYGDSTSIVTNAINPLVAGISGYVAGPGMYALLPIGILLCLRRKHMGFSFLVFFNLLLNILSSGSRIILVYTAVEFMIAMLYEKTYVSKNVKKLGIILVIVAIISIVILSNLRSSIGLFRSFYSYFSGPVVLFSYWMNYVDHFNIQSFGLSFLYPFTWLINAGSNIVGLNIESVRNVVEWQSLPQDVWIRVFPNQSMNAFSTLFYFFYEDFRTVGVCAFSFIYGGIAGSVFYQAFINRSTKNLSFYLLGVKALLGSFMIWQLGSTTFFLSFILMLLCLKKEVK